MDLSLLKVVLDRFDRLIESIGSRSSVSKSEVPMGADRSGYIT